MRLTVVGCTGSLPGPRSPASCYLVEADGYRLLLDLGSGASGPLQAVVAPHELDAIVLSHLHPDHCLDMTALTVLLRHGPNQPPRPIPVLAPPGAAERLASASYPGSPPSIFDGLFDFLPASPRGPDPDAAATRFGPFAVRTATVNHPVPTVAVRLHQVAAGGPVLCYSGDSGESDALVELARDADAFLCEASWGGSPAAVAGLHLSGAQAGEHARAAGVGRLLLTHIPPWESAVAAVRDARAEFDGPVESVRPGAVYEL